MPKDITSIIGDAIADEIVKQSPMNDEALLASISAWLDGQAGDGLFAATSGDKFKEWLDGSLLPQLRRMGENGSAIWGMICDPQSPLSKERIACIALTIAVLTGMQNADVSTIVSIVILAIRTKSRLP